MENLSLSQLGLFFIIGGLINFYFLFYIKRFNDYNDPTLTNLKNIIGGLIGILFGLYLLIWG